MLCFQEEEPYCKSLVINSQHAMFWIKTNDFSMLLSADSLQLTLSISSLSPFLHGIIKEKKP